MRWHGEGEGNGRESRQDSDGDHYLPTISLVLTPHPTIPQLYQRCFEYTEPWQWSPETELVETHQWILVHPSGLLLRDAGE